MTPQQSSQVELFRRALTVGLGVQLLAAPLLMAQDNLTPPVANTPAPADAGGQQLGKTTIPTTGSMIPVASDVDTPVPLDVWLPEQIEKTGVSTVEALVRRFPSAVGGGNFGTSRGNGGDGRSEVALRGIPGGTLVLINGRRSSSAGHDLNSIPFGAIERIEILKDGAASLYGADAVAGVVNIILRRDFNGIEVDARYGNTTKTDAAEQRYSIVTGMADEKTSLLMGATYFRQNSLYSRDRDRSLPDLSDPNNTSGTSNPGRIISSFGPEGSPLAGSGAVYRGAPGTSPKSPADFSAYDGTTDRFPFPLYTPAIRDAERWSFFGNADRSIFEENLRFFSDGFYTRSYSYNQLAPTPIVFNQNETPTSPNGIVIPASNPHNPFGVDIDNARYRPIELGPRVDSNEWDVFRFLGGFRGRIADSTWNWEAATLYTYQDGVNVQGNDISRTGLENAVRQTDPNLAFNPFGNAANTRAALDAIRLDHYTFEKNQLWTVDAKVGGEVFDLPGGPINAALGGEHREESRDYTPDGTLINNDVVGFNGAKPYSGSRHVNAAFYEVKIPVFGQDFRVPGVNYFELNHSGRAEDYSDIGGSYVPKVGFLWKPAEQLAVRGSYSESFTAPGWDELYFNGESFPELINPVRQQGVKNGTLDPDDFPPLEQISTILHGNPNLEPADSKNYTLSATWSPPWLKNLTLEAEWFRLSQRNVSSFVDQFILDENFRTGGPTNPNALYADRIKWDQQTLQYSELDATALNLSKRIVEGVDGEVTYLWDTKTAGQFTWRTMLSYFYRFDQQNLPGEPLRDRLGDFTQPEESFGLGSLPRLKGNTSLFWAYRNFEFGPTLNYVGSYRDNPNTADREIKEWITLDLQASYTFDFEYLKRARLTAGVLNVTDERPPLVESSFADKYDRDTHDLRGTFWYVSLNKKF